MKAHCEVGECRAPATGYHGGLNLCSDHGGKPKSKGVGGHQRAFKGHSDDWLTPEPIIKALGPFDLDPCASQGQPWETAGVEFSPPVDNGLSLEWFGFVWLNPPYGPQTGKWVAKLADHGRGIALIFARTETADFHAQVWERAAGLFFLKGRLHFCRPKTGERAAFNAGAPSVLVAYGAEACKRLQRLPSKGYAGRYVALEGLPS